jgi:hypothetical protein
MKKLFVLFPLFFTLLPALLWASPPVPFSGKVAIDGVNYFGQAKFAFAIHDQNGTVQWRNGATANDAINVSVFNGRYVVLLGGQGMNPLSASLFANHDELYIKVSFDKGDGQGLVHLAPDQRITAVPYAKVADMVKPGAITTAQLNEQILKYLKPEITLAPQAPGLIFGGQTITLNSQAQGKYLTHQWHKNGQPIAGATNSTITIADFNATNHDGNYSLVVSNDFGSVESVFVNVKASGGIVENGITGWWKFDENNGSVAYDSSGNGNDVNLTNGPTWISGKIGGALSFDGVDDFGRVDINKSFNPTAFSICCWVLFENANHGMILNKGMDNALNFRFYIDSSNNYVFDTFNPRKLLNNIGKVETSKWLHFTLIVDNLNQYFYKNGLLGQQGARSSIVFKDSTLLQLGSKLSLSSFCKFQIDDLRIYDLALSASEVQALYNLGQ